MYKTTKLQELHGTMFNLQSWEDEQHVAKLLLEGATTPSHGVTFLNVGVELNTLQIMAQFVGQLHQEFANGEHCFGNVNHEKLVCSSPDVYEKQAVHIFTQEGQMPIGILAFTWGAEDTEQMLTMEWCLYGGLMEGIWEQSSNL